MQSALVVIDVQRSLLDEGPWEAERFLGHVRELVSRARSSGAPVVFVRDTRVEPDGSLDASLSVEPDGLVVDKDFCDSFLGTPLHDWLASRSIKGLVICGMQTDYCIDTTCRRAASLGYAVQLVQEAHTTFDHEHLSAGQIVAHHNRILRRFPAGEGSVAAVPLDEVRFV